MSDCRDEATLVFLDDRGRQRATLELFAPGPGAIRCISPDEAAQHGEEPVQIFENGVYDFRLTGSQAPTRIRGDEVVIPSGIPEFRATTGRLEPGGSTGLLRIVLEDVKGVEVAAAALEVCSRKLGYRDEYRAMLDDIAERATDLLLDVCAPTSVRLLPDPRGDVATLQQRFAFLNSLIGSQSFDEALHRVIHNSHSRLVLRGEETRVDHAFRASASSLRGIARGAKRVSLPADHPLAARMESLGVSRPSMPSTLRSLRGVDELDTPENRFVKYALREFDHYLSKMQSALPQARSGSSLRLLGQVRHLRERLSTVLSRDFFKEISEPRTLPLGSAVLQRKEGYREVLQAWLKFDLAARLVWSGADDVFSAGKRDVSLLYEYWAFFQLATAVAKLTKSERNASSHLLEIHGDGFSLRLRSGQESILSGAYADAGRRLRVRLAYNKTFGTGDDATVVGSWTRSLRPDFTVSFWPQDLSEAEAESQDLMVHVHFDAKYRIESLREVLGPAQLDLDEERRQQRVGTYKRADLLKMHAYKDAIRRSAGAFVLYPGTSSLAKREFHEILPGLGAFALRPRPQGAATGIDAVTAFLQDVAAHVSNRASQREAATYHRQRIHRAPSVPPVNDDLPDTRHDVRLPPASERRVVLGQCSSAELLHWCADHGLFVIPVPRAQGRRVMPAKLFAAEFVLLGVGRGANIVGAAAGLWRVKDQGLSFADQGALDELQYPDHVDSAIAIATLAIESDPTTAGWIWDCAQVAAFLDPDTIVSTASLAEILAARVVSAEGVPEP